ncbi:YcxB family protein [Marinimicrococcus flavescens]|uniref:YcxB family protein n=1 Tax=Marinimicrococcus flavescens TaxID=3031815 RepID=A0AAP4D6B7_9PROT|nr:YcxB family protein [Marinimicrococcus flavescens]
MIEVHFQLAEEDRSALMRIARRRVAAAPGAGFRLGIANALAWAPLGMAVIAFADLYGQDGISVVQLNVIAGLIATWVCGTLAVSLYQRRLLADAALPRGGRFFERQTLRAEENGLEMCSAGAKSFYRWTAFSSVAEDKARLFLFLDVAEAIVVPKAALASAEREQALKSRIECPVAAASGA